MKGFVPTPPAIVDLMVDKLFRDAPPSEDAVLLDPGSGDGEFIAGVIRWCHAARRPVPRMIGIELDPGRAANAAKRFHNAARVEIRNADFLEPVAERFDYIIGNPPYVPITALSIAERDTYRRGYATARGRFDLYLLFFEQSLRLLKANGRLVFITPEKFLYVNTALPLRQILLRNHVDELHFLDENSFGGLVTYPLVTTASARTTRSATRVVHRDGRATTVHFDGPASWLPSLQGHTRQRADFTLADVCIRISCGVATGADSVYVVRDSEVPRELTRFAHPTISGRQVAEGAPIVTRSSMLVPYDTDGTLLPERALGALGRYLSDPARHERLVRRTCVDRKPWYAFHETPPISEMCRPKLICKDIVGTPFFVTDRDGRIIPRHSTYYVVPRDLSKLDALAEYLNSAESREWLRAHCQRAANGFFRMQSHVLKRLPVPAELVPHADDARELSLDLEAVPA